MKFVDHILVLLRNLDNYHLDEEWCEWSENSKEIQQRSRLKAYTSSKSVLLNDSGAYFTFFIGPLRRSEFFLPILTRAQDKRSGDDPPRVPRRSSCGKKPLFVRAAGGAEWPCGAPRRRLQGTKVGAGGREGGVPRGGAQRREEPPPLPALPLRSAPRPPTVPVPVAVPPAPASPCPERAGSAAPWPGRSGIGSSARS